MAHFVCRASLVVLAMPTNKPQVKMQALWQLAEYAEWNDWKPKWLWWRILRWCDRLNGHKNFEYEGDI